LFALSRGFKLSTGLRLSRVLLGTVLLAASQAGLFPALASDLPLPNVGAVVDGMGAAIPGVEIAVFPLQTGHASPLAILKTDAHGRFELNDLAPGSYLLALSKPGYQIQLAHANTRLLSLLKIHLTPDFSGVSAGKDRSVAGSMDWVLRLPRSDVLKEELPEVPLSAPLAPPQPEAPEGEGPAVAHVSKASEIGRLPLSGDVSQWYISSGFAGGPEAPESTGRTTDLRMAGDLLGRGDWQVRAMAGSLNTADVGPLAGSVAESSGANRLSVAMHYDVSPGDSVSVQARFDRDRFRSDRGLPTLQPPNQEVRTMGYQASWNRRIREESGLELGIGFLQAEARIPEMEQEAGVEAQAPAEMNDWRWNAGAGYRVQLPREHHLSVMARTRLYSSGLGQDGWILAPLRSDLSLAEGEGRGWSVSFSGEDSWKVAAPTSLVLGLDTHLSGNDGRAVILVPRVGAKREGERSSIQGWILLWTDGLGWAPEDSGSSRSMEGDSGPLGYHAECERRFSGDWTLGGHLERNPLGAETLAGKAVTPDSASLESMLLVDPGAWSQEVGFSVSKRSRLGSGTLESGLGRIVGRMAGAMSEAPVRALEAGEVRYLSVTAKASLQKTDTQVRLDFTRMEGVGLSSPVEMPSQASRMDLTVFQPLAFASDRGIGTWRVLFGYQTVTRDALFGTQPAEPETLERVHRFSGGVGVSF
jgi:carboxypeptidase family protein